MSLRSIALVAAACCFSIACKSSDASSAPGTGPIPGPTTSPAAAKPGAPTVGGTCTPGPDSLSCAQAQGPGASGAVEVTCAGGTWRALQACRGGGGCTGTGSGLHCDTGALQAGDPCMPSGAPAKCSGKSLGACQGGKWAVTDCPGSCVDGPPAACK